MSIHNCTPEMYRAGGFMKANGGGVKQRNDKLSGKPVLFSFCLPVSWIKLCTIVCKCIFMMVPGLGPCAFP